MKKLFITLCSLLLALCSHLVAQEYWYQQGFNGSSVPGWTRTCANTTSLNHTGEAFEGANAIKFDATCVGEEQYLLSPTTPNAGILSFWAQRNANSTLMDLHVLKVVDGSETEIQSYDAATFPHKNTGWQKYQIAVNFEENIAFKFYSTIREGNVAWFAIDDIELTKYGENSGDTATSDCISSVNTNFGDGTWGEIYQTQPASGSFPIDTLNGLILNHAAVCKATMNACPSGVSHTNRIAIDKSANNGYLEFPCFETLGMLEIHAQVGTLGNYFNLEEEVFGTWQPYGQYYPPKATDSAFNIWVNHNYPTKMRIRNNTGGGILIYKIKTTTYQEEQELSIQSTVPEEGGACYYNLTHQVVLNFNKNVITGTGKITLNNDSIDLSECVIEGRKVIVPVTLQGSPSTISYSLKIPQGAFIQTGDTVKNNPKTLHFSTIKTVAFPANYTSQIDVHYASADSAWQRMDIYYPNNPSEAVPVLINMHGGGWNHGEKEQQGGFNTYFEMGFAVCNVEYRMTGTATAPAAVVDVRSAMRYLVTHKDEYHIDPKRIVYQGGSAGAHLALIGGYLQKDQRYDGEFAEIEDNYKIIAVIDKYGPAHLDSFVHYSSLVDWLGQYANDYDFIHSISPCHVVSARYNETNSKSTVVSEYGEIPATYIVHGDADPTVEYEQSLMLVDTLAKYSIHHQFTTIPGGGHGGFSTQYNNQINAEIVAFLTELLQQIATEIKPNINENLKKNEIIYQFGTIFVGENVKRIEIFDITGRKLVETSRKSIDISNINSQIVIVKCMMKDGDVRSEKLITDN
ncbi:MAG: alpha/beta hydrolase fold domain-containing protein [Bacteroidales bacterium]|jgi:acetyl esterase/lipase|nr:alpha/beta hydrolase fold domain-containing protein [Bacteroidales bacterium]